MGRRGKRVCWVVIVVATAFIMGYLVKYGGPDYAHSAAPAPVANATLVETRPALPPAPMPTPSHPATVVRTRPAVVAPPALPKPSRSLRPRPRRFRPPTVRRSSRSLSSLQRPLITEPTGVTLDGCL